MAVDFAGDEELHRRVCPWALNALDRPASWISSALPSRRTRRSVSSCRRAALAWIERSSGSASAITRAFDDDRGHVGHFLLERGHFIERDRAAVWCIWSIDRPSH
jgi:hypothetical protein